MRAARRYRRLCCNVIRQAYSKAGLAASSINTHLAALRKLAAEAADNGLIDAELVRKRSAK